MMRGSNLASRAWVGAALMVFSCLVAVALLAASSERSAVAAPDATPSTFKANGSAPFKKAHSTDAPKLSPERAQEDADAILHEVHGFCDDPLTFPSLDWMTMCPLASEVPHCEGLVKKCELLSKPPPSDPTWLRKLIAFLARLGPAIGWTILGVGVGALLVFIVLAIRKALKREVKDELEMATDSHVVVSAAPPVAIESGSAEAILARAEAALARGDLRAALFGFLHASLRALDVRGAIRIARDRTNGEYVRSCGDESARPHLRQLVREVDVVEFGGREPEVDRVRDAGARARALVRAIGLTTLALCILLTSGCDPRKKLVGAAPRGFDVAEKLLERQGFIVSPLKTRLSHLADPPESGNAPTEPGPPMILDVTRTPLDTDAVEGLENWVKGGGTLVLFGAPSEWPPAFRAAATSTSSRDVSVDGSSADPPCDAPTDECEAQRDAARARSKHGSAHARLASSDAFHWVGQDGRVIAKHDHESAVYAAFGDFGQGTVLGVANSDLLTNVGLAYPGNPAALMAILAHLDDRTVAVVAGDAESEEEGDETVPSSHRSKSATARGSTARKSNSAKPKRELVVVGEHDGITGASNPLSSLIAAGFGIPLAHALVFVTLLALAVGLRIRAARPAPLAKRRAFVEHVEATGALYAYARAAPHALASYGRFVVERVRTRMARGGDVVSTLVQRSGLSREEIEPIIDRATHAKAGDALRGDELAVLQKLAGIYARSSDAFPRPLEAPAPPAGTSGPESRRTKT